MTSAVVFAFVCSLAAGIILGSVEARRSLLQGWASDRGEALRDGAVTALITFLGCFIFGLLTCITIRG